MIIDFRILYNNFEKQIVITHFRISEFFCILIWKRECRFFSVPEKYLQALSLCVSIYICKSIAQIEIYSKKNINWNNDYLEFVILNWIRYF